MKYCLIVSISFLLVSCNKGTDEKVSETASKVESNVVRAADTLGKKINAEYDTLTKKNDTAIGTRSSNQHSYDVTLTEYKIDMDESLPAGKIQLKVSNHGTMDHNFEIRGVGVKQTFTPNLKPDETRVMQLVLKPGKYEVSCPVDKHSMKGMKLEIQVK